MWLICNQVISFYHFRRKILQNQEGSGMLRFFINHVNFLLLSGKVSIKELFSGVLYKQFTKYQLAVYFFTTRSNSGRSDRSRSGLPLCFVVVNYLIKYTQSN